MDHLKFHGRAFRIVFDFGGVLFRWQPPQLLRSLLPQHAVDAASAQRLAESIFQGYGDDWAEFDRGVLEVPELVQRIAARTGLPSPAVQAVVNAVPAELQPAACTVALLQRLHARGRALHFLSNMPRPYAEHLQREHPFLRCFASGVFSAHVGLVKPEPAIFAVAAQHFGAEPSQLLLIDDVAENVEAARDAGWQALQFVDTMDCEARLRAGGWM
jgi:putative hydrolase of the HAD superfamily